MTILFSCLRNELGFITFFTKLSNMAFTFFFVTPLFSSPGTGLRMSPVKRVRRGEEVTLLSFRSLSQSFSNALASKFILLT